MDEQGDSANPSGHEHLSKLVDNLTSEAPSVLWHYTTPEGLLGILKSGELFATGLPYLNDSTEGSYMTDLVLSRLAKRMPAHVAKAVRIPLMASAESMPLAVTCFCKHGDLLGQWRAYTDGRGFAIGFDTKALSDYWMLTQREGLLARVQYKSSKSNKAAKRYAKIIHAAWDKLVADSFQPGPQPLTEEDNELVAKLIFEFSNRVGYLNMSGALHKPSQFSQEREWRFVTSLLGTRTTESEDTPAALFHERATPFGIAVYRRVAFQTSAATSPIRAIRIGPGLDVASQSKTLRRVLDKYDYPSVDIDGSTVPLRF